MKKNMMLGMVLALTTLALGAASGGQEQPVGVAGVDVVVKQKPTVRTTTDARGTFALDGLPAGSYAIIFKARKANDVKSKPADKVTVASTYAIKIDGAKRNVLQNGLTTGNLIGGLEMKVDVAAGAHLRGQVTAGAVKNMVWIPKEPDSNVPGHWAEAGSPEAKRAFKSNSYGMSGAGLQRMKDANGDEHQEGFGGGSNGISESHGGH
jgi:hypothetical protein